MSEKNAGNIKKDEALQAIPDDKRQHWITPAMILAD